MRVKMEAGRGMTENLNDGGIRDKSTSGRERNLRILIRGRGIVLKFTAGCGMRNGKSHTTDVTRRTATLTRWIGKKNIVIGAAWRD